MSGLVVEKHSDDENEFESELELPNSAKTNVGYEDDDADEDEDEERGDQLPNVEEYKANMGHVDESGRQIFWKVCAITSFLLLLTLVIIIIATQVPQVEKDLAKYWWVQGQTEQYNLLKDYIIARDISTLDTLDDPTSPQFHAAQWMAHGDASGMEIPAANATDITFDERYAMVVLYFSTGGHKNWTNQYNFLTSGHICEWGEMIYDEQLEETDFYGVYHCYYDEASDISYPLYLHLPDNNLVGTIPQELKALQRLQMLLLEENPGLTGTLPDSVGPIASTLTHFMIQYCNIKGSLPPWIYAATNLKYLGMGGNGLSGPILQDIQKLTDLRMLALDANSFTGDIHMFAPLTNLKRLYLDQNMFGGKLDIAWMDSMKNLVELDLSENALESTKLPDNLFNNHAVPKLRILDLHGNEFTGVLPIPSALNYELEFLSLHENKLSGEIPHGIKDLKALEHLDLTMNEFTGTLPEMIGFMTHLQYLYVGSHNMNHDKIPDWLVGIGGGDSGLHQLRGLSMENMSLKGSLPPELFDNLEKLKFLDLHGNALTGSLPTQIWIARDLEYLMLQNNQLTGTLPTTMQSMTNLKVLYLEHNNMKGNANTICQDPDMKLALEQFVMDCSGPHVECSCCSTCCTSRDFEQCYSEHSNLRFNWDPSHKTGYNKNSPALEDDL